MKKVLVLLMAMILVFAFVSCNSESNDAANDGGKNVSSGDTNDGTKDTTEEARVISIYSEESTGIQDTVISREIERITGFKINLASNVAGSENEGLSLAFAADERPDIVVTVDSTVFDELIAANQFIDLGPLIEEHGPNIKAALGQHFDNWIKRAGTGELSYIMTEVGPPSGGQPGWGVAVRYDLLKETDVKIKNLDDWNKAIRAMQDANPTAPDGKPAYAFSSFLAEDWGAMWGLLNWTFYSGYNTYAGANQAYYDIETGKATVVASEEDEIFWEAVDFFRQLNLDGYFDPRSFEMKYDDYVERIASGHIYSVAIGPWATDTAEAKWKAEGTPEKIFAWLAPYAPGVTSGTTLHSSEGIEATGRGKIAIPVGTKNPEEVIKYLDFLISPEGKLLINRGIEGVHYDIVDGQYVMKDEVIEQTLSNATYSKTEGIRYYDIIANNAKLPSGQGYNYEYDPKAMEKRYDEHVQEMLEDLGQTVIGDEVYTRLADQSFLGYLRSIPRPDEVEEAEADVVEALNTSFTALIRAETDAEFQAAKEEHLRRMENSNYQVIVEFFEKIWQENIDYINANK